MSVETMTSDMKVVEKSATSHQSQLADQIWTELDTKGDQWKREREGIEKDLEAKITTLEEVSRFQQYLLLNKKRL